MASSMMEASSGGLTGWPRLEPKALSPHPGLSLAPSRGTPYCVSCAGSPTSPSIISSPAALEFFLYRNLDPELSQPSSQEPKRILPQG